MPLDVLLQVRHELGGPLVGEERPPPIVTTPVTPGIVSCSPYAQETSKNVVAQSDDPETAMRAGADAIDELLRRLLR